MKKLLKLVAFVCLSVPLFAQNLTTVSASNIQDLNGAKLAAGQLCFLGTDQNDNPISFQVGGGGQVLKRGYCSAVAAGVVASFTVPNPANTLPSGVYYRVTVKDSSTGVEVLRYTGVTFAGGTFNFDTYTPVIAGASLAPLTGNTVSGNLGVTGNVAATGTVTGSNIPGSIPGTGACTNQFVRALNGSAVPTCNTVGSSDLASSLALTTPNIGAATGTSLATSGAISAASVAATGAVSGASASISGATTTKSFNNVQMCDQFAGATADVKIAACIAALPSGGGIADARGFGAGNQTIAATVTVGTSTKPVTLWLNPATIFIPSTTSTDMFAIGVGGGIDGLTAIVTSLSTYSGNVVKFPDINGDTQRVFLRNFIICNGTATSPGPCTGAGTGITTGNAILLQATNLVNSVFFVDVEHGRISGFNNGIFLNALGTIGSVYAVNGNHFNDVEVKNAVNCINLTSANGDLIGNQFVNIDCEFGAQSSKGIATTSAVGNNLSSNMFVNVNMWDYTAGETAISWGANTRNNLFMGQTRGLGGTLLADSGLNNNMYDLTNNQFGADYVNNISGNFLINTASNGEGIKIKGPDTQWNIQTHVNATNDLCLTLAGVAVEWCTDASAAIFPNTTGGLTLGKTAQRFSNVFTNALTLNGGTGLTGQTGTGTSLVTNTGPTISAPVLTTSMCPAGSTACQHKRVAGCATAASVGATCDTTVTWTTAFSSSNYTPVCSGEGAVNVPLLEGIAINTAKTASAITVRTYALTAAAANFGTIDCAAFAD